MRPLEAAEWLSNETRIRWDSKRIIDFSIQKYRDLNGEKKDSYYFKLEDGKRIRNAGTLFFSKENLAVTLLPPSPTYLSVKFPEPVALSMYRYRADTKEPIPASYESVPGGLVRVFSSEVYFAPLYPKHLGRIYLYGKAEINQPSIEFIHRVGWEYTLFDPLKSLTPEEVKSLESYSRSFHGYLPHDAIAELGGLYHVTIDIGRSN